MNFEQTKKDEQIIQDNIITLLKNMGYTFISREEMTNYRPGFNDVILKDVLFDALNKLNSYEYKGKIYKFDKKNLHKAIDDLNVTMVQGSKVANQQVYEKLTMGESYKETIDGDQKSFSLKYIDFNEPQNNVYHFTEEFDVKRMESADHIFNRRPDIVVFVNGIPLSVIELKSNKERGVQGITQMIRNQNDNEIPYLFKYAQVLIAGNTHESDIKYGTSFTGKEFYSVWREELKTKNDKEQHLQTLKTLTQRRQPTKLDETIYSLLKKDRLLSIIKNYIVYDGTVKKIARYQQYFAIEKILNTVSEYSDNKRKGGLIWHTQGSGKSLTMLMLAKRLKREVFNSKVVIVTDRKSLDKQISETFKKSSDPRINTIKKANSGGHLVGLINKGETLISTLVHKFEKVRQTETVVKSSDIFILIDESHRTQFGSLHTSMKKVFPNACYLGFTGTPLLKKDKNSVDKFDRIIHEYKIDEAVKDNAVLPLLYESRVVEQFINDKEGMDRRFNIISRHLTEEQEFDLKNKYAKFSKTASTASRLEVIAMDINEHFLNNIKGTKFKAMLATASKTEAIKYNKIFKSLGDIKTAFVISSPDDRNGQEEVNEENKELVIREYNKIVEDFGDYETYEERMKDAFIEGEPGSDENLELLIVVDKLLTGFDAPKAQYLYVDKPLKEHKLLQAIARVNRLENEKDFGIIIDYRGLLGNLENALTTYSEFSGYDESDIAGTLISINEEIRKVKEKYSHLSDLFKEINFKNLNIEKEEYIVYLSNEETRKRFYALLKDFSKSIKIAFASEKIFDVLKDNEIKKFKQTLKFYATLRKEVGIRYQESVDFKEYEEQMQKLLDTYISSKDVIKVASPINIFNKDEFATALNEMDGDKARATMIEHAVKKTISGKFKNNPAFYEKLSEKIEEILKQYRLKRMSDAELLKGMLDVKEELEKGEAEIVRPSGLFNSKNTHVLYDNIALKNNDLKIGLNEDALVKFINFANELFREKSKKPEWETNNDVKNEIEIALEDWLYNNEYNVDVNVFDELFKSLYELGVRNYGKANN